MLSRKKVGDSVWSFHLGDCRVVKVHGDDCEVTKLSVSPDGSEYETMLYLSNGKQYEGDHMPTCYPERPEWVPPPVKMVNGLPVPDIALAGERTSSAFVADPTAVDWVADYEGVYATMAAKRGLAYPRTAEGKEAARLHAMALLGLKP